MFYISGIYDKALTMYVKDLYCNHTSTSWNRYGDTLTCNIELIDSIMIAVYDTSDNSTEWYFVQDLLNILQTSSLTIQGIDVSFYKKFMDKGYHRIDDAVTIRTLHFHVSISKSGRSDLHNIAKVRMLGIDIDSDGTLNKAPENFVTNGVFIVPDYVLSFARGFADASPYFKSVTSIMVHKDFDLYSNSCIYNLKRFMHNNLHQDATLIVNDDFRLTTSMFSNLKCNILVKGDVKLGNFNNLCENIKKRHDRDIARGWWQSSSDNEIYFIEDNTKKYKIDLVNFTFMSMKK